MKQVEIDILNVAGFYGPFRADRSCVVDRTGEIVLIVNPSKPLSERDAIARIVADAMNAAIGDREQRAAA